MSGLGNIINTLKRHLETNNYQLQQFKITPNYRILNITTFSPSTAVYVVVCQNVGANPTGPVVDNHNRAVCLLQSMSCEIIQPAVLYQNLVRRSGQYRHLSNTVSRVFSHPLLVLDQTWGEVFRGERHRGHAWAGARTQGQSTCHINQ